MTTKASEPGNRPLWAANIIRVCVGLQGGESLLVVVDEPLGHVRDALLGEASRTGPAELWSYTFSNAVRPFDAYPRRLLALATEVDVVVLLLSTVEPTVEVPAWVASREVIRKGRARFAAGAYIDQSILDHELSADYEQIAAYTLALEEQLRGSRSARITSPQGTDLALSLAGREWRVDTGILRGRGAYGNLPAGEVYVAPVEDSAEGVLVIDKSLPGLLLSEPVQLTVERGVVTRVEGGAGAEYLRKAIAQHGDTARVIAELGIGTNPVARLQGNIITDEKALGTIHIAIGRNDFLGGKNASATHIDGVVGRPTLEIDGRTVLREGNHVSPG